MTRRQRGAAALVAGVLLGGLGIGNLVGGQVSTDDPGPVTTTVAGAAPTTSASVTTTRPTTTTADPTTSSTIAPGLGAVERFVVDYRVALDTDDVAFLFEWLHPAVKDGYGFDLCRDWVAREIATLESYQLTGPLIGPSSATIATNGGTFEVDDLYSGPISFVYQGAFFEDQAQFAVQEGSIYWLGICR
jgi:hypothetical protein